MNLQSLERILTISAALAAIASALIAVRDQVVLSPQPPSQIIECLEE